MSTGDGAKQFSCTFQENYRKTVGGKVARASADFDKFVERCLLAWIERGRALPFLVAADPI
jgi:hypothetical protein